MAFLYLIKVHAVLYAQVMSYIILLLFEYMSSALVHAVIHSLPHTLLWQVSAELELPKFKYFLLIQLSHMNIRFVIKKNPKR